MTIPTVNNVTWYYNSTITLQSFCISDTMQTRDSDKIIRKDEQVLTENLKAFEELEIAFLKSEAALTKN